MKFYITCKECGEEVKVDLGSGKAAERKYEYMKDNFVCENCKQKAYEAKKEAEKEEKLANGNYTQITVHYSEFKNNYEGFVNANLETVIKGEYHAEDKTIDLLVPAGKLVKLTDEEINVLKNDNEVADILSVFKGESNDNEAKKAEILAKFEEADEIEEIEEAETQKEEWNEVEINECFVVARSQKSVLIQMPSRSDFAGYKFWHPKKCFKELNGGLCYISFTDEWNFKLEANGGALKEELSAERFLKATNNGKDFLRFERADDVHVPFKLDAVENAEALDELIDND